MFVRARLLCDPHVPVRVGVRAYPALKRTSRTIGRASLGVRGRAGVPVHVTNLFNTCCIDIFPWYICADIQLDDCTGILYALVLFTLNMWVVYLFLLKEWGNYIETRARHIFKLYIKNLEKKNSISHSIIVFYSGFGFDGYSQR